MECFDLDTVSLWLNSYGSFTLFLVMAAGIIAFPVPEETLMVFTGVLIQKGKLPMTSTLLAAYLGAMCGITVSYLIGLGTESLVLEKWGSRIGVTKARLDRAHGWFERYGKWMLLFGYYIPGLRHFIGIAAGISGLIYQHFALFAYSGALIWVSTFVWLGYFLGCQWFFEFDISRVSLDEILVVGILITIAIAVIWQLIMYKKS